MKRFVVFLSLVILVVAWTGTAGADPDPELLTRAQAYDQGVRDRHVPGYGGLVQVVYENEDLQTVLFYKGQGDSTMWTATYAASQAFRYAVTGESEARENAIAAVHTLLNHMAVTQTAGYVGRYVGPLADQAYWLDVFQLDHFEYGTGLWTGTFYLSNSSSDQYVGFFHGLALVYDLVDDAATRVLIRQMIKEVVDKLRANLWLITGEDGLPTTAAPGIDNTERCVFALIAAHVLDTQEYWDLYDDVFADVQGSIPFGDTAFWNKYTDYFAMNLKHQIHFNLFRLEPDTERLAFYFDTYMDKIRKHVAGSHQTYFDYVYLSACERMGQCEGSYAMMEDGVAMLGQFQDPPNREIHIDPPAAEVDPISVRLAELQESLPEWLVDLIGLNFQVQAKYGYEVGDRCRQEFIWQRSPYQMSCVGYWPTHIMPGVDYLLAYWMGRYYGYLDPHDIDAPDDDDDTADDDTADDDTVADDDDDDDDEDDDSAAADDDDSAPPGDDDDDDDSGCGC